MANLSTQYLSKKYEDISIAKNIPGIDKTTIFEPITNKLFLFFQKGLRPRVYDIDSWEYREIEIDFKFLFNSRSSYANKLIIWGEEINGYKKLVLIDGDKDIFQVISIENDGESDESNALKPFHTVTWLEDNSGVIFLNREKKTFSAMKLDDIDWIVDYDSFTLKSPTPIPSGILIHDSRSNLLEPIHFDMTEIEMSRWYSHYDLTWFYSPGKIATLKKDGSIIEFLYDVYVMQKDVSEIVGENLLVTFLLVDGNKKKDFV